MRKSIFSTVIAAFLGLGLWIGSFIYGSAYEEQGEQVFDKAPEKFNEYSTERLLKSDTKNVTRIAANDQVEAAVQVSQTVWPATHDENRPGVVILAPKDNWQAAMAASNLIHHPNDGPVLYYGKKGIPVLTKNEIKRLNPKGNPNGTQIIFFGEADSKIQKDLKTYKVDYVRGDSPAELGKNTDEKYAELSGELPKSVIMISGDEEDKLFSLPALSWISHMPEPPLFVTSNDIPNDTKEALKKRNGQGNLYILGPKSAVSGKVEKNLAEYGKVTRIAGDNPVANSIAFAKFKDRVTGFGWGITEPGHGLALISTSTPQLAQVVGPFAHRGKPAPIIFLENGQVTSEVYDFLATIKPTFEQDPTTGPFNHVFLIGKFENIPYQTQGILDEKLEIVKEGEIEL